jgi:N-acetylglucosaminyl-diphospho-decaprenol L-rhamnosyltransferase
MTVEARTEMTPGCQATVIVINRNGRQFLAECLTALDGQTLPRHQFEVLFVDNASTDGSAAFVRDQFPHVRVINSGGNLGFTGANNLGIHLARGPHVVLLNNDTRVEPDWLERLLASAEGEKIGGAVSRLLFRNNPERVNSTGLIPYRDGRVGDRDLFRPATEADPPTGEVFGGCGASLLLTRGLLDDIGGLDPRLFIYYEDVDIAWRSQLRGWRFIYARDSVCHHVCGGVSAPQSPFVVRQTERNRAWVNMRNAPPFEAVWSGVGLALRAGRMAYRYLRHRDRYALTAQHLRAMAWAVGWVTATLPLVPLARYRVRMADRRRPDRVVRRFVRTHP